MNSQGNEPHLVEDFLRKTDIECVFLQCETRADAHVSFVGDGMIPKQFFACFRNRRRGFFQ